jgi:hypothetical protein
LDHDVALPDYIKIEADFLWTRDVNNEWTRALERKENEHDVGLFERWKQQKIDELTKHAMEKEIDRIHNIISWIMPWVLLSLALLLGSYFD